MVNVVEGVVDVMDDVSKGSCTCKESRRGIDRGCLSRIRHLNQLVPSQLVDKRLTGTQSKVFGQLLNCSLPEVTPILLFTISQRS